MTHHDPHRLFDLKQMTNCAGDLNSLAPNTEKEFLRIGEMLNKLASICYSMTDDALQLSSLSRFNGDDDSAETSFIQENSKIFDEVTEHVRNSISTLNDGESLLDELLVEVKKLRTPLQGLSRIGKTFRVLGISIKVESSRNQTETQGFRLLADEVADIAQSVQNNCRYCIDKTDEVERGISTSRQVLKSSQNSYDDSGERAIDNILHSLEELSHKSEMLAEGIQERSTAMVQGIGEVVMAMQFHDITRQQLENVSHALLEATEKAGLIDGSFSETQREQSILEIYSILSVQAAHLNSIYEQIFNARKTIESGLSKTMEQARVQAGDARTLLEMEEGGGKTSVVTSLENEIDNIIDSLNTSLGVVKEAAEVSHGVYGNVSKIGDFVNKIEEIAFDVKILAINAMVEAIKTNTSGNALIVLAKELSNLSQDTRDGAANSIESLQTIIQGTERQLEYTTNLDQNRAQVDEMIERAHAFTGTVLSSLQQISSRAEKMDNSSRDLASRITKLIPGIKFPQVMGDRINKNWQIICQVIDSIDQQYPQFLEKNEEVKQMLEKLSQQYVMDRERDIHAQVTGGDIDDSGAGDIDLFEDDGVELFEDDGVELFDDEPVQQDKKEKKKEDFGDNVELF